MASPDENEWVWSECQHPECEPDIKTGAPNRWPPKRIYARSKVEFCAAHDPDFRSARKG